jgi:hypothetical protein
VRAYTEQRRSHGALFAFIDLLFLMVAFLVLVLFFMKTEKTEAQVELETVQERLATVEKERSAVEAALSKLSPLVEQFALQERKEIQRRRALAAREIRRKLRATVRVSYRIERDGSIIHEGQRYSLEQFKRQVVDEFRKSKWLAFRAFATPETPFGRVVLSRRRLLKEAGEFDTYWDNLTKKKTEGRKK